MQVRRRSSCETTYKHVFFCFKIILVSNVYLNSFAFQSFSVIYFFISGYDSISITMPLFHFTEEIKAETEKQRYVIVPHIEQ